MTTGRSSTSPLVLVVDDDAGLRLLAQASLAQNGFRVEEATDGAAALDVFESLRPDVVLLDVMMPRLDGYAACQRLRELPGGEHTPILMMTGLDDVESIERAYQAGATDFITKPIVWSLLHHRVRYMLRARQVFDDLRRSESKNKALLSAMPDVMLRMDETGQVLELNAAGDVPGHASADAFPEHGHPVLREHIARSLAGEGTQIFEYAVGDGDEPRQYEMRISASGDAEALAIVRDITERKRAEERVHTLAYYDGLTSLPNRALFLSNLRRALASARRQQTLMGMLFFDLDGFKQVNDTLGHHVGDLLLRAVAHRARDCLRESDYVARMNEDSAAEVARLGGDEFSVILPELADVEAAGTVAGRIVDALSAPFDLEGHEVFITPSIGIAVFPDDGDSVDDLLKNADAAMYQAKAQGGNGYQYYGSTIDAELLKKRSLLDRLAPALERGEFRLYYQPQVDLRTGRIVGVEALLRWRNPDLGLISPARFIPIVEQSGMMLAIGEWTLRQVCAQALDWEIAGLASLSVAVNLSGVQLWDANFPRTIQSIVTETGLEAGRLTVEIDEAFLLQEPALAGTQTRAIKALGVHVCIDQIGSGPLTLDYAKGLAIDCFKLGRALIADVPENEEDCRFVKSVIKIARSMGCTVTACGVESEQQSKFLRDHDCDVAQGFVFSRPLSGDDMKGRLKSEKDTR